MRLRAVLLVVISIALAGFWGCGGGGSSTSVTAIGVMDDFDSAGTWVPGGTLSFNVPLVQAVVNTTLARITYDAGTTGNATITLASSNNVVAGMLLAFNPGGSTAETQVISAGSQAGTFRVRLNNQHAVNEAVLDNGFAVTVATGTGFLQSVRPYNLGVLAGTLVTTSDQLNLMLRVDNGAAVSGGRLLLDIDATTHDFAHTALYADFTAGSLPLVSVNLGDLKVIGTNAFGSVASALSHVQGIRIQLTTTGTVNAQVESLWLSGIPPTSSTANVPVKINVSPTSLSLNLGNVDQLTPTAVNAINSPISTLVTFTYTSSNPSQVTVSPSGLVCAGRWDANFVNCTGAGAGTAQITAAAAGLVSDPVPVYVHQPITAVTVSPSLVDCRSQGQTQQMTVQAFSGATDITSTVGPFQWSATDFGVVTFDATTLGLVTAKGPGRTNIYAQLGGVNAVSSAPAIFVTCPVQSIVLHLASGPATAATMNTGDQVALAADVLDTHGTALSNVSLTFPSNNPSVATVANNTVVAFDAGTAAITAACNPPGCNPNLFPIYSNVFTATVNGTSATTVFAASTTGTSLVPIDTTTNTAGSIITLPSTPNSILEAPLAANIYLGSSGGLIRVDAAANTATTISASITGQILVIAPDGSTQVTSDQAAGKVFVVTGTGATSLNIPGATQTAFNPDGTKVFIVTNTGSLVVFSTTATQKNITLPATAHDVAVLSSGWFTYLTQTGAIAARATCDSSLQQTVAANDPTFLAPVPDGSKMLAVDPPALDVVTVNSTGAGCPPLGGNNANSVASKDLGAGDFTARQLIVLPDSSKAYVVTNLNKLLVYNIATGAASSIPFAGGVECFSGGATLDSKTLYLGCSDNTVHRIDVAAATDAQQIVLTTDPTKVFTPDLVVVRRK
jgi:hypothetical protein